MTFARLIFARFIAVVLFLQGTGPAFLLGVWRPGGWFLTCSALIYILLAAGLWQRQRWALSLAFGVTLPQLMVFSSSWFSWAFYVFDSRGFGVVPADTVGRSLFFTYRSFGGCLDFAFGQSQQLLTDYAAFGQRSFVLFNVLAVPLLLLLVALLASDLYFAAFPPVPDHVPKE